MMSGATVMALKAAAKPGRCVGCGRKLPSGAPAGQVWCRRAACRKKRARAYARDHRKPSGLFDVATRENLTSGRVKLTLYCGCVTYAYRSKAKSKRLHCRVHS